MCRFIAYLGEPVCLDELVLRPTNSLVNQSLDAKEFRLRVNGDGFGVAWYGERPEPVRYRTVRPAWSEQNLRSLAPAVRSRSVLAHVRAASPGLPVVETNCHPFVHERFAFCHNGAITEFGRLRRAMHAGLSDESFAGLVGTTDSEVVFAYVLDAWREQGSGEDAASLATALAVGVRRVTEIASDAPCYLNLALTNGESMAVCRYSTAPDGETSSLYVQRGRRYTCEDDVCRMVEPGTKTATVLVASERLSDDPGWESFPAGQVAAIGPDGGVAYAAV